jgi:hypothetical protein
MEIIEWILRGFGLLWIFGGIMIFKKSRTTDVYDEILTALQGQQEEKLTAYYGYGVGALTFLSGVVLLLAHPFAPYCVAGLVVFQAFYFSLKHRRYLQAKSDEEREDWIISRESKNAFLVSLMVMLGSMILYLR